MSLGGGCMCGQVRYVLDAAPDKPNICHCTDCRRAAGAPMVAWFTVPAAALRFTAAEPARYQSSPGASRGFCARCGTSLTFQDQQDLIDVSTCSLDSPEAAAPAVHIHTDSRVPWIHMGDGLPCHPRSRADGLAPPPW